MANLYDMLFGSGTGAIQPLPYTAPAPPPSYADLVSRFADPLQGPHASFLTYPQGAGSEVRTPPVLTPPPMTTARSTPTVWPYDQAILKKPLTYNPNVPAVRKSPDFGTANRLTADMTGGGRPATAVAAIEQASPRWPALSGNPRYSYTARPHMALQRPSSQPVHDLSPAQDAQAQQIADELRMPVRRSNGTLVQPSSGQNRTVTARMAPSSRGTGTIPRLFDAATGGAKPTVLQDIMRGIGSMQMPRMGGPPITAPGGGGAFVNHNPQPNTPLAMFESGAVLPASMNNERWRTGR